MAIPNGIYRVDGVGPDGGSFIAFRLIDGEMYWIRDGQEYLDLVQGGNPVHSVSEADMGNVFQGARLVGSAPPSGYLSQSNQQLWAAQEAAAGNANLPPSQQGITNPDGESVIYRIEGGPDGGFIAFRRIGDQMYWIRSGDELQQLVDGGSPVLVRTQSQMQTLFSSLTLIGDAPPTGWLSDTNQGYWERRDDPNAPTDPTSETPEVSDVISPGATRLFSMIAEFLQQAGLGHLTEFGPNGEPGGWLWEQILGGNDTEAGLTMAIEQLPEWQQRFAPIVEQRRRRAEGLATIVMTPLELMEYEATAAQIMRNAGLPRWMQQDLSMIHDLVLNDISEVELNARLGSAWNRVRNTDPLVRQAFQDFFGVGRGDAEMAAFFLDPDRTIAHLEMASRTAYAAGFGQRYDLNLNFGQAERIAQTSRTEAGIEQGFSQINQMRTIFSAGITEHGELTGETTGLDAVFDGDGRALREIERRVARRRIHDQSSVGGALMTNQGLVGAREAR